ncbi:MAG: hypothetical protein K2K91_03105 [Ruminococcus sp.]|nr:hypothetical protein [Ruminococcus sp.]
MKNDDIISHILEKSTLDEIKAELDAELDKSEVDYDKVAQLTEAVSKLTENSLDESQINENISKINQEYNTISRRNKICHIYKWIGSLSACLIMAMALNCYTMVSFGENIFTAIVEMTKSGFVVDFSGDGGNTGTAVPSSTTIISTASIQTSTTPAATTTGTTLNTMRPISSTPGFPGGETNTTVYYTTEDTGSETYTTNTNTATTATSITGTYTTNTTTAATIIGTYTTNTTNTTAVTTTIPPSSVKEIIIGDIIDESCKALGIDPCFLDYKANLQLENFSYDRNELSTDCYFTFTNDNTKLNITIEQYNDKENIPQLLIPSNNSEYHTIYSNIGNIYLFDDGSNSKAVFLHENTVYTLSVYNMSMKQLEDIVISYSATEQK